MLVALAIILDVRRVKENGKYPVKLRVNYNRVTVNYQTVFELSQEEYQRLSAPRIVAELQQVKNKLKQIERETEDRVKQLPEFSFAEFEKIHIQGNPFFRTRKRKKAPVQVQATNDSCTEADFDYIPFQKNFSILLETSLERGTIGWSFCKYIKRLIQEGRIGTAVSYHCSYVSLKKYKGNASLKSVSVAYLKAYEQWVKGEGLSKSTIGMYLRALRAVINEAIESGLLQKETGYPFGKRKYQIPTARKIKKALALEDVEKIYYVNIELLSKSEQQSRDYWLFSYLGNGMNPKDIACLKYSNIHDDYLVFERAKTERSRRDDPEPITVFLTDDMKAIICRWGNNPTSPESYLFPILEDGIGPLAQYKRIYNFVKLINNCMKEITRRLGIDKKATTYVARHTFATVLKRSGASTEFIKEALGHAKVETTENYLDDFDRTTKKEFAMKLTAFKTAHAASLGHLN